MNLKDKFAAFLRRWAYALSPESSRTLPPGYEVRVLRATHNYALQPGEDIPDKLITRMVTNILTDDLITGLRSRPECFNLRADLAPIPGGLVEYSAVLYVGVPQKVKTNKRKS